MPRQPWSPRIARWAVTTPGRFIVISACLVVLGLLLGFAGLITVQQRSALAQDVGRTSGPLSVHAQDIYRSLSDADAMAANAFLANGVEPPALRQRYLDDIARASTSLSAALRDVDQAGAAKLQLLTNQLPVYTGLVETARTYNRIGLPLGAAYLREASGLMRQTLLPAAQALFDQEVGRLAATQRDASSVAWWLLLFGLLTLGGLFGAQMIVARRTNRRLNLGLVAASLAALILFGWTAGALTAAGGAADRGRTEGSTPLRMLAEVRVLVLQARADEALTLIARGNGAANEQHFMAVANRLTGGDKPGDGNAGLFAQARRQATQPADRAIIDEAVTVFGRWLAAHQQLRALDSGGQYLEAVRLATDTTGSSPSVLFGQLDAALTRGIASATDRLGARAGEAQSAFRGTAPAIVVLTVLLLAGTVLGLQRRIGEYR